VKYPSWREIAELIGVTAIVASLIFVGLQLQQDRMIGLADSVSARAETDATITQLVNDNREVWINGLNGAELSEADELTFYAIAETIEQHLFGAYIRARVIGAGSPEDVQRGYAMAIYTYPGLRRIYVQEGDLRRATSIAQGRSPVSEGFRPGTEAFLAEFDRLAIPIPTKKSYVYW
jgi:hypothetical protein